MRIDAPLITGSLSYNGTSLQDLSTYATTSSVNNLIQKTGSYALTGSNYFSGSQVISGSITATGNITAQTLIIQTVTSSVLFSTGSNIIGSSLSNVQQLTGSVGITGSLAINGTATVVGSGTANYVPKFTASGTIGNSSITDAANTYILINKNGSSITAPILQIVPTTTTNSSLMQLDNAGAGTLYIGRQNSAGNSDLIGSLGAYASVLGHTGTQTLHLITNSLSRLSVDGSGIVGIGTITSTVNSLQKYLSITDNYNVGIILNDTRAASAYELFMAGSVFYINYGTSNKFNITAAGNVGIGTTSPTMTLSIRGDKQGDANEGQGQLLIDGTPAYNASNGSTLSASGAGSVVIFRGKFNAAGSYTGFAAIAGSKENTTDGNYGGNIRFYTRTNGADDPGERMRIMSGGDVLVGTTTSGVLASANGITLNAGGMIYANSNNTHIFNRSTNSSGTIMQFRYNEATVVGTIAITSSTTSYNTSSDYRLKEDLKEIKGLDKVSAIKVYDYKWKSSNDRMDGVLAHELQEVIPYAVTGIKDGEDMQGVDYSKIVPVLVKAIQELSAKVTLLENK